MRTEVLNTPLGFLTGKLFTKRVAALVFATLASVVSAQTSYIPPISTTASTTLFSNGATAISPGRVAVDKAGNTFYINHVAPFTLYEIPATSPATTTTAPVALITGLGQYNSEAVFVDPKGNLWIANGNGSITLAGSTEYIGLIEVPAANGLPNTAALTAGGETVTAVAAANCTASSTVPCVWQDNTFATNFTNYYVQPGDLFVDGTGNVYFTDIYDGNTSGKFNRVLSFNIANPGTGTLVADNLASNPNASIAVDASGKVYYNDSTTGSGTGKVSVIAAGVLTTVGTAPAPTVTSAAIASATGLAADTYGNLYISSATQISEVPFEATGLNFSDEFVIASALTSAATYGGFVDLNGNYAYASATNVQQLQINGFNFGSVPVGTLVNATSAVPAPTLNLYFNTAEPGVSSYFITGSPTQNTLAASLQSFPYGGTKSLTGGTSYTSGQTGTILMDFQPIHPGLLKGSFTPRSNGANDTVVNLQGTGVGPQSLFLPGIASALFATANASATSATSIPLKAPLGLAVDTFGDIFVADSGNGKVTADCLSTTTATVAGNGSTTNSFCGNTGYLGQVLELGTGFTFPAAIALDGANNLYVVDSGTGIVTEINGVNVSASPLVAATATFGGTVLSRPAGIAVDGYSNVFIADTGNNRIVKAHQFGATATQNVVAVPATTLFGGTALSKPQGLALDSAGNLFIADTGNNRVVEFTPAGVTSVLATTGVTLAAPTSLAILPSGTLVVTDSSSNVSLLSKGTGTALPIGTLAPIAPQGVALDLAGNIYVSDTTGNRVLELNTSSPALATFAATSVNATSPTNTTALRNSGNISLTLSAAPTIDTGDKNFNVLTTGTCATGTSLTPAATCTVQSNFSPQVAGPLSGTITLTSNQLAYTLNGGAGGSSEEGTFAATGNQAISVTGTGVAGNGTTAQTITFTAPASPVTFSRQTITLSASSTSGLAVTFSVTSGPATVTGNTLTITGGGTVVIAANQAGNGTYAPAAPVSQTIIVNPAAQTITFTAPASPVAFNSSPITLSATASSGLTVTFTVTSGPATVNGNTLTLTGAGTVVLAANQAGNSSYTAAPAVSQSITVTPASQTITFTPPPTPVAYGSGTITLTGTASSGLTPVFTVTSGPGTISGSTLTITGVGTIVIAANQPGNANYNAAPTVSQSVVVNQAAQTITFAAPTTPVVNGVAPITLSATATSGLAVTFSVTSGPATINGNTLTITGAGTVVVSAIQAGNANYAAAPAVTQTIVVSAQPIAGTPSFNPAAGPVPYASKVAISAATTGSVIYYTLDGSVPTTKSAVYSAAIPVTISETISAIAVAPGYQPSAVATAAYTVAAPSFTLSINPGTITVTAGLSNSINAIVTPVNSFQAPISLACSGLPTGATCTFSPSTLTPVAGNSTAIGSTVTIFAPAGSARLHQQADPRATSIASGTALAALFCLISFRKRRRIRLFTFLLVAAAGLSLMTGCIATPAAPTYATTSTQVLITATAAALPNAPATSATATFTLNIQ